MLTFDAHLDLSLNALGGFNRDLRLPVHDIRRREAGLIGKGRACGTTAFPEMRQGRVGLCVATQLAGCMPGASPIAGWMSPEQAYAETQGQLAWYKAMEEVGEMRQVTNLQELEAAVALWQDTSIPDTDKPICYILSLEGADSIRSVGHLEKHWQQGLRALGPAHYGVCRYALGHDQVGGLPPHGKDLVREMDRLGLILDVTHLSDGCFWDALEIFNGPVWASHSNCRALDQIRELVRRDAVIGVAVDAIMLVHGWRHHRSKPQDFGLSLERLADHIDHICQLAGDVRHVGIGTDADGGFGTEQMPVDLGSIADIQKLAPILARRGYSQADIEAVFHGNFLALLRRVWK